MGTTPTPVERKTPSPARPSSAPRTRSTSPRRRASLTLSATSSSISSSTSSSRPITPPLVQQPFQKPSRTPSPSRATTSTSTLSSSSVLSSFSSSLSSSSLAQPFPSKPPYRLTAIPVSVQFENIPHPNSPNSSLQSIRLSTEFLSNYIWDHPVDTGILKPLTEHCSALYEQLSLDPKTIQAEIDLLYYLDSAQQLTQLSTILQLCESVIPSRPAYLASSSSSSLPSAASKAISALPITAPVYGQLSSSLRARTPSPERKKPELTSSSCSSSSAPNQPPILIPVLTAGNGLIDSIKALIKTGVENSTTLNIRPFIESVTTFLETQPDIELKREIRRESDLFRSFFASEKKPPLLRSCVPCITMIMDDCTRLVTPKQTPKPSEPTSSAFYLPLTPASTSQYYLAQPFPAEEMENQPPILIPVFTEGAALKRSITPFNKTPFKPQQVKPLIDAVENLLIQIPDTGLFKTQIKPGIRSDIGLLLSPSLQPDNRTVIIDRIMRQCQDLIASKPTRHSPNLFSSSSSSAPSTLLAADPSEQHLIVQRIPRRLVAFDNLPPSPTRRSPSPLRPSRRTPSPERKSAFEEKKLAPAASAASLVHTLSTNPDLESYNQYVGIIESVIPFRERQSLKLDQADLEFGDVLQIITSDPTYLSSTNPDQSFRLMFIKYIELINHLYAQRSQQSAEILTQLTAMAGKIPPLRRKTPPK